MPAGKDIRTALRFLQDGDWRAAHEIVQEDEESPLSCWAHGIVHLMEGDVPNARYWYRLAGRFLRQDFSVEAEITALQDTLKG